MTYYEYSKKIGQDPDMLMSEGWCPGYMSTNCSNNFPRSMGGSGKNCMAVQMDTMCTKSVFQSCWNRQMSIEHDEMDGLE
jgi:hypothetical protein